MEWNAGRIAAAVVGLHRGAGEQSGEPEGEGIYRSVAGEGAWPESSTRKILEVAERGAAGCAAD